MREDNLYRQMFKGLDTVTYNRNTLKQNRIKEMINDMTKKFGNQVLGVHGQELPKFFNSPEHLYWKNYKGYKESPQF